MIGQIADGLSAMHAQGLLHRDVKPHNILFCGERPKLGDFGLARSEHRAELARLTADGTTVGTLPYLAPELLAGAAPTPASDVYGLAVTAYQALTGELPRPLGSLKDMIEDRGKMPPPASSILPELRTFDAVLAEGLSVDPAARPSPMELASRLRMALEDSSAVPGEPDDTAKTDAAKTAAIAIASVAPPGPPVTVQTETIVLPVAAEEDAAEIALVAPVAPARPARPMPGFRIDPQLQRRLLGIAAGIVGVAAFIVVAAAASRMLDTSGFFDVNALNPTLSSASSSEPTATLSASPLSPALAAIDEVLAAIDAARGGSNGLKGGEANDLTALANDVRAELQSGDVEEARESAAALWERANKVAKDLDGDRRARLLGAIDQLRSVLPAEG
jgi:serine/threonine-protein kinase